jgi:hypothetical protein
LIPTNMFGATLACLAIFVKVTAPRVCTLVFNRYIHVAFTHRHYNANQQNSFKIDGLLSNLVEVAPWETKTTGGNIG